MWYFETKLRQAFSLEFNALEGSSFNLLKQLWFHPSENLHLFCNLVIIVTKCPWVNGRVKTYYKHFILCLISLAKHLFQMFIARQTTSIVRFSWLALGLCICILIKLKRVLQGFPLFSQKLIVLLYFARLNRKLVKSIVLMPTSSIISFVEQSLCKLAKRSSITSYLHVFKEGQNRYNKNKNKTKTKRIVSLGEKGSCACGEQNGPT